MKELLQMPLSEEPSGGAAMEEGVEPYRPAALRALETDTIDGHRQLASQQSATAYSQPQQSMQHGSHRCRNTWRIAPKAVPQKNESM